MKSVEKKNVTTELGKPVKRICPKKSRKIAMPLYRKPIKMGDKGNEVLWAVRMLQRHGSSVKETEVFHIGVRSAVVSYQKKNKLKSTGTIDKKTWDSLNR